MYGTVFCAKGDSRFTSTWNHGKETRKQIVFVPPTLEEVEEYCRERMNTVDANKFVDFYSAKGWMVGKNKMKDWKAAVRTWEKNDDYTTTKSPQKEKEYWTF